MVQRAPYHLLLGRLWQKGVKLEKVEWEDGTMDVEITDPGEEGWKVVVTKEQMGQRLKSGLVVIVGEEKDAGIKGKDDSLTEAILTSTLTYNTDAHSLAYKKVANKV